jgi:ribosomal protein S18 acetylase RimI-like enzyme
MIRPTIPADTPELLKITQGTGLFLPADLEALESVLKAYHEENAAAGHRCFTDEVKGEVIGFVYYAPAAMTDRTWYLWWIVVSKQTQAKGVGSKLLKHAEDAAWAENGRLMMIDTSSLPTYDLTRRFYLKHGYEIAAVVKDFYADAHDLVMFRKRLLPTA